MKKHRRKAQRTRPAAGPIPAELPQSEAEQTLHALRSGLIDALVITEGAQDSIYAVRSFEEVEAANRDLLESQERLLTLLNEHERLMQDLHDGCIQSIYAVGLALEHCRALIKEDPDHASRCVAHAEASLNLVIQELRSFISGDRDDSSVDLVRDIARLVESAGQGGPQFRVTISAAAAQALPP